MTTSGVALIVVLGQLLAGAEMTVGAPNFAHDSTRRALPIDTTYDGRGATGRLPCRIGDCVRQQIHFDAARFDSVTAYALRSLLDSAAERGLPTAPLINRALEGAARKAGGPKILLVVRQYVVALESAREMLGTESSVAELEAGASALRAGIDARMLTAIRASRAVGAAVTPLVVMTDIVARGVPAATARDAVTAIARMPRSDEALLGLQVTVAKNSVRGPGMAVDAIQRYLRGTVPGSNSSSAPATVDRKPIRPPSP